MAKKKTSRKKKKTSKKTTKKAKKKTTRKKKTTQKGFLDRKVLFNLTGRSLITILALVIGIPLGIFIVIQIGTLGTLVAPPAIGEFTITVEDSRTSEILNASYDLIYVENETYLIQNQNQTTIHSVNASEGIYALVNITGYYPSIVPITASTSGTPRENVIQLKRMTELANITLDIISLDEVFGDFTSSDFDNLNQIVNFDLRINITDEGILGKTSYLPNCTLDNESYAFVNQTVTNELSKSEGLWLGISSNIEISNITIDGIETQIMEYVEIEGSSYTIISISNVFSFRIEEIEINMDSIGESVDMILVDGNIENPNFVISI
jgi:hypothetical protein